MGRCLVRRIWEDSRGQDLVEYVLIVLVIALGIGAAMLALRGAEGDAMNKAVDRFNTQAGG